MIDFKQKTQHGIYLPLFERLDALLEAGDVRLAVDGGAGSGKSTLAKLLEERYGAATVHIDDFFLPPHLRYAERYSEVGGNFDRERFCEEVMAPILEGRVCKYRRFDCKTMTLCEPTELKKSRLTVFEGSYSMHRELRKLYNLSVFLNIGSELQRKRIEQRNSPDFAKRFFEEWIPMEERYFKEMKIPESCDIIIDIK